jgi:hypothetical protein
VSEGSAGHVRPCLDPGYWCLLANEPSDLFQRSQPSLVHRERLAEVTQVRGLECHLGRRRVAKHKQYAYVARCALWWWALDRAASGIEAIWVGVNEVGQPTDNRACTRTAARPRSRRHLRERAVECYWHKSCKSSHLEAQQPLRLVLWLGRPGVGGCRLPLGHGRLLRCAIRLLDAGWRGRGRLVSRLKLRQDRKVALHVCKCKGRMGRRVVEVARKTWCCTRDKSNRALQHPSSHAPARAHLWRAPSQ